MNYTSPHCCNSKPSSRKTLSYLKEVYKKIIIYKPLLVIAIFCTIIAFFQCKEEKIEAECIMSFFMGHFLIFLSIFKFFDLQGFVNGFSTYDIITKKFPLYGYIYPFIEFALGIAYIIKFNPYLTHWMVIGVMALNSIGILKSFLSGQKVQCACLGTALNVPLSTISIIESVGMMAMAAYNLF